MLWLGLLAGSILAGLPAGGSDYLGLVVASVIPVFVGVGAMGTAAVISLVAGLLAWGGAAAEGITLSLPRMLEAGASCLPVAVLFLGIAA